MKKIRFRDTISTKMDFLLWKGDDGMRKNKGEKVVKSRASWKKADQVRKIKIVMTFVVVALCISIAAGAVLAWIEIEQPFAEEPSSAPVSSQPPVSSEAELPVYDNTFNLVVVNLDTPLPDDFTVQLEEYEGFSFEERIVEALSKMVEDARADGIALEIAGGYISKEEQDKLTATVITPKGLNRKCVGRDARTLLSMIGIQAPENIRCIVFEGEKEHPLIAEELMMPILGLVRAKDFDDAVEKAVWLEHGNRHSAHIHSKNVDNITKYAKAIDTAILVKNAPSYAALGFGGEGFCTFTIASRTGEGLTSASTFTKRRRCVMSDSLCIR